MLKKLLAFIITFSLVFNCMGFISFAAPYSNASDWAKEAISEAEKKQNPNQTMLHI